MASRSSDEEEGGTTQDTPQPVRVQTAFNKFYRVVTKMASRPEIYTLTAVILSVLFPSRSINSPAPPISQRQPPPTRFFASMSRVSDYHYGQLTDVAEVLNREGSLAVMYYAPWCAASRRMKTEFELAAKYFAGELDFVAINCWYEHGQCRKTNQFLSFPVIYFYHRRLDGYKYSGIGTAEYIIDWLERMMYPFEYLTTQEHFVRFLAQNNQAVIGYFDFNSSPQPPGFQQFYYAAMRVIEADPKTLVPFAIVTTRNPSPPSASLNLTLVESGTVFFTSTLNDTEQYPSSLNFTSSSITTWVKSEVSKSSRAASWTLPSGTKSQHLSQQINTHPALVIFTPHYPLAGVNHKFSLLNEVALMYNNCRNGTKTVDDLVTTSMYARWADTIQRLDMLEKCADLKRKELLERQNRAKIPRKIPNPSPVRRCCMSTVVTGDNTSTGCDLCMTYTQPLPSGQACPLMLHLDSLFPLQYNTCQYLIYHPTQYLSLGCSALNTHSDDHQTSHTVESPYTHVDLSVNIKPKNGHKRVDMYVRDMQKRECDRMVRTRTELWRPPISSMADPGEAREARASPSSIISGLGCHSNHSLMFIAMDTRVSWMFARELGVQVGEKVGRITNYTTTAVIIDNQNEVHYLLEDKVTRKSLESFIHNFTTASLPRYLRSQKLSRVSPSAIETGAIVDVTTSSWDSIVLNEEKDVVLLYFTEYCGFCAGIAHIYLSLAKYFRSAKTITFARINADQNDLPWHYTVDAYPTIIFFPAYRKHESVPFPEHLQPTLAHLVRFVLQYATRPLKIETGMSVCTRRCIRTNIQSTVRTIQTLHAEISTLESRLLRYEERLDLLQKRHTFSEHYRQKTAARNKNKQQKRDDSSKQSSGRDGDERVDLSDSGDGGNVNASNAEMDEGQRGYTALDLLSDYVHLLRGRLHTLRVQASSAKRLFLVLRSCRGPYIEMHKLSAVVRGYEWARQKLRMFDSAVKSGSRELMDVDDFHEDLLDIFDEDELLEIVSDYNAMIGDWYDEEDEEEDEDYGEEVFEDVQVSSEEVVIEDDEDVFRGDTGEKVEKDEL